MDAFPLACGTWRNPLERCFPHKPLCFSHLQGRDLSPYRHPAWQLLLLQNLLCGQNPGEQQRRMVSV